MALAHPGWVLEGGRTNVDSFAPGGQRSGQRVVVADAAGKFDSDVETAHHRSQQFTIRPAPKGRVEIDEMNPLRTSGLPCECCVEWVAVVRCRSGLALHQPHGLPAGYVDCRQ